MKSAWIALVFVLSILATKLRADEVTLESVASGGREDSAGSRWKRCRSKAHRDQGDVQQRHEGRNLVMVYAVAGKLSRDERQAEILVRQTNKCAAREAGVEQDVCHLGE